VSLDPLYTYFDMERAHVVQIRQAIGAGRIKITRRTPSASSWGCRGAGLSAQGDHQFHQQPGQPRHGQYRRAWRLPQPVLKEGVRLLSPGMFVRIHLPIGQPHPALLVIDRAIGSDQGLKYVYVIDAQNKAAYRRVTTGALQADGLRVITEGLKAGEWVAVGALQQIRPKCRFRRRR